MTIVRAVASFSTAALLSLVSARRAEAQLEIGTWVKTATANMPELRIKIEACCGGGRRLTYLIATGATKTTLTIDTKLDGAEVPVVVDGKPTAETMIIKRVDAHHATNILKMNGKLFASSTATLSADGKTLTVVTDNTGGPMGKQTDIYVKQ